MIDHRNRIALVRERRNHLLSEAARQRLARAARRALPRAPVRELAVRAAVAVRQRADRRRIALHDGGRLLLRPIGRADAPLLADAFDRLSPASRRARFLGPKHALSAGELRYFTQVDQRDHVALFAINRADGRAVGVARFVRDTSDSASADLAVTVVDAWQHRGLGAELLAELSRRAQRIGVCRFSALVAADNVAAIGLLSRLGSRTRVVAHEFGVVEYEVTVAPGCSDRSIRRRVLPVAIPAFR